MIWYSRNCVSTIMNLVFDSTKVNDFLYHTNLSHEVPLSFVWLKFSSFGWDIDMRRIRSGNTLSLGIPKAPQVNIQGRLKHLSLGMPRKASPLSSSKLSVYLGFCFVHMTYVLCVFVFPLRTMLVWDVPSSIYRILHVLHLNLLSTIL